MNRASVIASLCLVACGGAPVSENQESSAAPLITVSATAEGLAGAGETRFDFARLRNLHVRLHAGSLDPQGVVRIALRGPDGDGNEGVFARDAAPYATGRVGAIDVPGMDHPVAVAQASAVAGGFTIDRAIPIEGSQVARFAAPGAWTIEAEVDGRIVATARLDVTLSR